jgi:hypothetical protein
MQTDALYESPYSYDVFAGPLHARSISSSVHSRFVCASQSSRASACVTFVVGIAPTSFGYGNTSM